jgi:hypothetical protein
MNAWDHGPIKTTDQTDPMEIRHTSPAALGFQKTRRIAYCRNQEVDIVEPSAFDFPDGHPGFLWVVGGVFQAVDLTQKLSRFPQVFFES